ncbi:nucleotidyltransferase domain-containing protein [Halovivax gelatinilyticus]|uniref:nucleotidyltransferase domain-containing protein n=1 Tax=Halovivax gelatinilyticus TaxID=2961597 RepID=UPI0020CA2BE3|nr:nucleotidyltransferase domain-containing protein [Halovivax gelatinilyticus]
MRRNEKTNDNSGISIAVPIPAMDSKLYGKEATDDLLLFLATHRFDEFGQRELARQIDYSESAIRRAVAILEENDLVDTEYRGNQKSVRINRCRLSVPDDPILRIPQEEFQLPVETATERLKSELDSVVGIVLHGSIARGEADRRSDIDLWVVVQDDRAPNQRKANSVEKDLEGREFDGQRYDFHVTVESVEAVPSFAEDISHIVLTGITVYNTEHFETLRNLLAHGEFDDSPV